MLQKKVRSEAVARVESHWETMFGVKSKSINETSQIIKTKSFLLMFLLRFQGCANFLCVQVKKKKRKVKNHRWESMKSLEVSSDYFLKRNPIEILFEWVRSSRSRRWSDRWMWRWKNLFHSRSHLSGFVSSSSVLSESTSTIIERCWIFLVISLHHKVTQLLIKHHQSITLKLVSSGKNLISNSFFWS